MAHANGHLRLRARQTVKRATILRKLRDFNVPLAKAQRAADRFGDDHGTPTPMARLQQTIVRAGRQKLVEQHRREFRTWCRVNMIPNPTHEYQFGRALVSPDYPRGRAWAFDWCWPDADGGGLALEIEGGIHVNGRHVRGAGYEADMAKYTQANLLGWRLIRVSWATLYTDETAAQIKLGLDGPYVITHTADRGEDPSG